MSIAKCGLRLHSARCARSFSSPASGGDGFCRKPFCSESSRTARSPRRGSPCRAGRSPPRRLVSASKSCGGMTPPTTIMMSPRPGRVERRLQRRHSVRCPAVERRDADECDIGSTACARRFLRRREERPDHRRRSRYRQRPRRSPSGRGHGRPGRSWRRGCAGGAPVVAREGRDRARAPRSTGAASLPPPRIDAARSPGSRHDGGSRHLLERQRKSRRRWPWRAPHRRQRRADCPRRVARLASERVERRLAVAAASRSAFRRSSFSICAARTRRLSTFSMSIGGSSAARYMLTPTTACSPASMRACVRAAASSMRSFGMPASIALAMPPSASISSIWLQRLARRGRRSAARRSSCRPRDR